MKCVNCGFEIEESSEFCVNCGKDLTDTGVIKETFSTGITKKNIKSPYIIGMLVSTIAVVVSFLMMFGSFAGDVSNETSSGNTVNTSHSYYGGDAYTGMQQASADASNNAAVAAENVVLTNKMIYDSQKSIGIYSGLISLFAGAISFSYFFARYKKDL